MLDGVEPAADPAPAADPVQAADQVQVQGDAFEGAAEKLFPNDVPKSTMVDDLGEKPKEEAEPKAEEKPTETPEEKAAREAAETPEQKAAREAEEAKAKKPEGAPETYEPFKFAEGAEVSEANVAEFTGLAKELNLTQDQAQKLVDYQTKLNATAAEAATKANTDLRADWQNQVKTDKEFGGDKLPQSLAIAQKAIKQFGDAGLSELVNAGLGDHPAFIRFALKVGQAISEAPIVTGGKPANSAPESVLYPNLK